MLYLLDVDDTVYYTGMASSGGLMDRLCLLGLGYVGLPAVAPAASNGFSVVGVDVQPQIVQESSLGGTHVSEPELSAVVEEVVRQGRLRVQTQPTEADVFPAAAPIPLP